jgi:hypothetical protein
MSYLKMALKALEATSGAGAAGAQKYGFSSQAANHTSTTESPQSAPPASPVTCAAACPWYAPNPWSHNPTLLGWCHRRMEPLAAGSPACEEFRRGEVLPRQNYERVPAATSPASPERILTCFDCPRHEHDTVNRTEGWGHCTFKGKGYYGLRRACSEIPRDPRDG